MKVILKVILGVIKKRVFTGVYEIYTPRITTITAITAMNLNKNESTTRSLLGKLYKDGVINIVNNKYTVDSVDSVDSEPSLL